jgi:4-diphosphocytidyl-2-C-methyl-D-erythritol kinase
MIAFLRLQRNDLEVASMGDAPVIGGALAAILRQKGCGLARMSGSGATCFGLFATEVEATAAANDLRRSEPAWWVAASPVP